MITFSNRINTTVLKFYTMLIFLYFSDMTVLLGMIWTSYQLTDSSIFLGTILSISLLFPFLIKQFFPRIDLLKLKMNQLFILRVIIYIIYLIFSINGFIATKIGFTFLAVFLGLLTLSTLSTFESNNAKLVHNGLISNNIASRVMQTVLQIGAFSGALIGGSLLKIYTFTEIVKYISIFDIIICLIALFVAIQQIEKVNTTETAQKKKILTKTNTSKYIYLCIPLGLIGLHIASFNILTPIIFQKINHWDSTVFGLASGVAGIGAFCAAFINIKQFKYVIPSLFIVIFDTIFCFSPTVYLSILSCFFIGFSINTIRIKLREDLISLSKNNDEANEMGALSAIYYAAFQSVGPLLMGIIVSDYVLGIHVARYLLPCAGILIFLSITRKLITKNF